MNELEWGDKSLTAILNDLQQLIECESPSADLAAVARSADLISSLGEQRLGSSPERIVIDGCTHLRWQLGSTAADARRVVLLAHHDTVWPLGTLANRPFAITDGILTGPGCFDMLTGLVMAMHVAAQFVDRRDVGLTLLVTGDEELGSPSSRGLIEETARGAVAALVLEASADGALKIGRKGTSIYQVQLAGKAAHAGLEPENGINATVELAHQVIAVAELSDTALGTTVTPTLATGGQTQNTVPDRAEFAVDVRAATVAEQERVDRAFAALVPQAGAEISIAGGINRPPLEPAMSQDLLDRTVAIAQRLGLPEPRAVSVGGASDGNFTAALGVPTLDGLGAAGGGAHAADEHVLVDQIPPRTALLRALVSDLLG
ncbi:M20/M25/M40 family metallo-hydrolase [Naumannella halotolerans]|uniref:Glutamate carboxypeptidase n=1 Tax=Naumannella halotolerans TaxID=993414 RepID=A0A4R7J8K8_9ACTN|nr:M20/M25/M40 family metallo-hydrolase [Naumannella halotolerans]TDT33820.1 glutamate carboxypeptidase [Naumannella halotolerans]